MGKRQDDASKKSRKIKGVRRRRAKQVELPVIRPDTAGIDVGAEEIFVAVSPDRSPDPVRSYGSFTADLRELVEWLKSCRIKSVAMESTGVYWIPLHQMLCDAGMDVCLVNARHFHNVPGRKTDVQDSQWLQYLHAVGLLRNSFRPDQSICAIRTLMRHRKNLVELGAQHVLHMQKAMEQMNLKLQHVISEIIGVSGLRIIDAILSGERNPKVLAKLRDGRIQASEEVVAKSLEGDYRTEYLITLKQALEAYRFYQKQIDELDRGIESLLDGLPAKIDLKDYPLPENARKSKRQHNAPGYDVRRSCYRAFGVDVTAIPGIGGSTAQVLLSEIGTDLAKFPSASAFANWLALCPNPTITGGKVLQTHTRNGSNRAAIALRLGAQTVERTQTSLGSFFRAMRARLGRPEAITAVAHKMARIFYTIVSKRIAYDETILAKADSRAADRKAAKLRKQATAMGFELVPRSVSTP